MYNKIWFYSLFIIYVTKSRVLTACGLCLPHALLLQQFRHYIYITIFFGSMEHIAEIAKQRKILKWNPLGIIDNKYEKIGL